MVRSLYKYTYIEKNGLPGYPKFQPQYKRKWQ